MENARTWRGCKGGRSEKPPGYQRQLQTHHARVTRPRRTRTPPLLGLLVLAAHWRSGRARSARGWEEGRDLASTSTAPLSSQLCHKLPAQTSDLLLRHTAGAAIPARAPIPARVPLDGNKPREDPDKTLSNAVPVPPSSYITTTDLPPARCLTTRLTQTRRPWPRGSAGARHEPRFSQGCSSQIPSLETPQILELSRQTQAGPHVRAGAQSRVCAPGQTSCPTHRHAHCGTKPAPDTARSRESTVWRGKGSQNGIRVQRNGLLLFFFLLLFPLFPRPAEHSERTDELLTLALSKSDSSRSSSSLCTGENQEENQCAHW